MLSIYAMRQSNIGWVDDILLRQLGDKE